MLFAATFQMFTVYFVFFFLNICVYSVTEHFNSLLLFGLQLYADFRLSFQIHESKSSFYYAGCHKNNLL